MTYIPQVGHCVLVDFDDLGLSVETIHEVSPDGSWILLFQHEAGEQHASADAKGQWRLQESGQKVLLLDPQQKPEPNSIGFVFPTDGPVEKWVVTSVYGDDNDEAEACQHTEADGYQVGVFGRGADGVWRMHTRGTVIFMPPNDDEDEPETLAILADENAMEAIAEGEAEFAVVQAGDKFSMVSGETVEFWDYAYTTGDGEFVIRRDIGPSTLIRRLVPTKDELERTPADWRCVDDPDSFDHIVHMPRLSEDNGPQIGDVCTRVLLDASLVYRIRDFEQYNDLRIANLTLAPDVLGFHPYAQVSFLPGEGWKWENGDPCTFTSGRTDDLARKATRLDILHAALRLKYFYYEGLVTGSARVVASAIRDEYAEQLFLAETGLMAGEDPARFQEFAETLHAEYLASVEK